MCAVYRLPEAMESLPSCTVSPAPLVSHFSGGVVVFSPDSLPSFSPLWETASAMSPCFATSTSHQRLPAGHDSHEASMSLKDALTVALPLLDAVNCFATVFSVPSMPRQCRVAVPFTFSVFDPSLDRVIVSEASLVSPDWPDISAACVLMPR